MTGTNTERGAAGAAIVPLTAEHAAQVLAIYRAGIDEGNTTFKTSAPGWEAFDAAKRPAHRFAGRGRGRHGAGPGRGDEGLRPVRVRRDR